MKNLLDMKKLWILVIFLWIWQTSFSQKIIELTPAQKQQFLQAHNAYRQKAGAPPLRWSEELENYAKRWAIVLAKTKRFQHSPSTKYGENLYQSTFKPDPKQIVDQWAEESKFYHGEKVTLDNYWIFGHYTQIIWKQTRYVGCAIAQDNNGIYYVVCEYSPPGNKIGQKPVQSR